MSILKELNQRPIAYYPLYAKLTGSTTAGILLSQLMYWFSKKDKIFKTDIEILEETMLTENELRGAKLKLKNVSFIKITREGMPAKTFYKINWQEYERALLKFLKNKEKTTSENHQSRLVKSTKLDSGNSRNLIGEIPETINKVTEITTKTTSDIYGSAQKNQVAETQKPKSSFKNQALEEKSINENVSGYGCENQTKKSLKKTRYTNADLKDLGATREFIDEFCNFSRALKENNGATTDELKAKMSYFAKKIYELESEQDKKRIARLKYQAFKKQRYGNFYYLDPQNFNDEKEWLEAMPEVLRKKVRAVNVENLLFKYFLPYLKAKTGKCVSEIELIQIANTLKDYSQLGQVLIVCRCMYGNWIKLKPYSSDPKDKWNDNPIFLYSIKNNEPYFGGFKYEKRWL
ncbi:hypothetical protein [Campylobacter ureolyticus]|uniref:Uncharacterized protein n=1 Tax=Campylobacter ureolyticus TaxID=827 RepID=A0A9Q4PRJ1_9BACT|nr:hypothetical protein [Campylobacter ureolyticus]MCZ6159007.1 hypothetical protein [Campylobacter ureolyticus]